MNDEKESVDLSSLQNFDLSPDWLHEDRHDLPKDSHGYKGHKKSHAKKSRSSKHDRGKSKPHSKQKDWLLSISPHPEILRLLKDKIKESAITYALKEIADVVASKPNRLSVKISALDQKRFIWASKQHESFYLSKKAAVNSIVFDAKESFLGFKCCKEIIPKGNVQYILQCPKTKKLLPPHSFHEFEDLAQFHLFSNKIKGDLKDFISSLVRVEDQKIIDDWKSQKIQLHAFYLKNHEHKLFQNLNSIENAIEKVFFDDYFTSKQSIQVCAGELNGLDRELQSLVKQYVVNKMEWMKQLFSILALNLRRSKFCLFKKNNSLFVRHGTRKSIDALEATDLASKIIVRLASEKNVLKKDLFKSLEKEGLVIKEIVVDLKWLISEGYINEYSDSSLELN